VGRIVVGLSSWADPGFVAEWYPPGLPARARLPFYAERFEAVELKLARGRRAAQPGLGARAGARADAGPVAVRFGHRCSDAELREIRGRAEGLAEEAGEVRVMFNNNRGADAPIAARRFRQLLGQDPGPEAPTAVAAGHPEGG
jgi:uncharacterized protein YecE (DUF72 family)